MNLRIVLAALATLALAACAQTPKGASTLTTGKPGGAVQPIAPHFKPTPGLAAADRQRLAVDLLDKGQADQARAELNAVLAEQPSNGVARKLLDQIDRDPRMLLGEKNYAYKVRAGETMSALAQRFLGDPLMFYALARYNNIPAPSQMEVGQTLLIPGVPRKVTAKPGSGPAPAAAVVAGRNPARAAQLRGQGLERLNRGAVDQAVGLFRQALTFDPGSAVIQKDLDRALRIQKTVRAER